MNAGLRDRIEDISVKYFGPHNTHKMTRDILCEWRLFYTYNIGEDLLSRFLEQVYFSAYKHFGIQREDFDALVTKYEKEKYIVRLRMYYLIDTIYDKQKEMNIDRQSKIICIILKTCFARINIKSKIMEGTISIDGEKHKHFWLKLPDRYIDVTFYRSWDNAYAKISNNYIEENELVLSDDDINRGILASDKEIRDLYFDMLRHADHAASIAYAL